MAKQDFNRLFTHEQERIKRNDTRTTYRIKTKTRTHFIKP